MAKNTATTTTKTPAARQERTKKEGLRKPQVRILEALTKAKSGLTRNEIAAKAPVDVATLVELLGSKDPEKRAANDEKHFKCLLTLKFVKDTEDEERGTVYSITAAGKAGLEKFKKEAAAK